MHTNPFYLSQAYRYSIPFNILSLSPSDLFTASDSSNILDMQVALEMNQTTVYLLVKDRCLSLLRSLQSLYSPSLSFTLLHSPSPPSFSPPSRQHAQKVETFALGTEEPLKFRFQCTGDNTLLHLLRIDEVHRTDMDEFDKRRGKSVVTKTNSTDEHSNKMSFRDQSCLLMIKQQPR